MLSLLGSVVTATAPSAAEMPLSLSEASGLLVRSVGDSIGRASDLLYDAPSPLYPLTSALRRAKDVCICPINSL